MQSTSNFLISPKNNENFINTKEVDGKTLIINTSIEYAENVNRIGVVKALPLDYDGDIKKGDEVVVQHNIFRDYFDGAGLTRKSDFHVKDNLFYVPKDLVYMYIRNGKFFSADNFVFISPIVEEKKWIGSVEVQHIGIVKYTNRQLSKQGVKEGTKIAFHKDCEYLVPINGERLFRMRNRRILAILE